MSYHRNKIFFPIIIIILAFSALTYSLFYLDELSSLTVPWKNKIEIKKGNNTNKKEETKIVDLKVIEKKIDIVPPDNLSNKKIEELSAEVIQLKSTVKDLNNKIKRKRRLNKFISKQETCEVKIRSNKRNDRVFIDNIATNESTPYTIILIKGKTVQIRVSKEIKSDQKTWQCNKGSSVHLRI
jgi:outer membrane murein-binding lipoprotein Lpp